MTLISNGQTLVVTNGMMMGTAADSGENQVVHAAVTGANGTLTLSNGILAVTQGSGTDGAHQATLDLSGLGTFNVVNVAKIGVAVYQFPAQTGNGGQRSSGILYLARTNSISVTSTGVTNGILVGWNDNQGNGSSSGVPNGAYWVLAATNVSFPITNWMVVATNAFDANGNFSVSNSPPPVAPQTFYLLKLE